MRRTPLGPPEQIRAVDLARPLGLRLRIFDAFRPAEAQWMLWDACPDPEFLADAQKRKLDLLPGRHDELEKTVAEAFAASPAEIEIARKYYKQ